MIRFALSLTILALFASPLFAQSLPERLAAVERNNAALTATVERIEADVSTIKMNTNAMAAKVDALDAKVERLMKATPSASHAWKENNAAIPFGNSSSFSVQPWSSSLSAAGYGGNGMMVERRGLFGRIFGARTMVVSGGGGRVSSGG
jgi:hypothetical protein